MRAILISLLLIITSKNVLANFSMKQQLSVKSLSSTVSLGDNTQDSIVGINNIEDIWTKNYQNLNLKYREEMLSFLKTYLSGDEYYLIKVGGEATNFIYIHDLVDLFIHLGDKYSLDSRFVLAVHVSETSLTNYTTLNNPGNVGNNDHGKRKEFTTLVQGFEAMFYLLLTLQMGKSGVLMV